MRVTWFPAMLNQLVVRIRLRQGNLILMGQVKIINAKHQCIYSVLLQRGCQWRNERRLAHALHAIETNDKRALRRLRLVKSKVFKDERDAYRRLVVYKCW